MDTNVIICKWRETEQGWRLWVKGRPKVFGEGRTYEAAEDALIDAIMESAGDLDAVIPVVPEYDPPLPAPAAVEKFMHPELFLIWGDEILELHDGFRWAWLEKIAGSLFMTGRRNLVGPMYTKGLCAACGMGIGERTEHAMFVDVAPSDVDGGFVRGPIRNSIYVFSGRFLSALRPHELAMFEFRPVQRSGVSGTLEFFEMIARSKTPYVSVKGFDASGVVCRECGQRSISVSEPMLQQGGVYIADYVCRTDLPSPLPSCFPVGDRNHIYMCMTRERWDEIRGSKCARGIASRRLGVVSEEECERSPRLCDRREHCRICLRWVNPVNVDGEVQRCWRLPAETFSMTNLQWVKSAEQDGLIQIVRSTISLDELARTIDENRIPRQPEIISFRCPDCWRLGRIVLSPSELLLSWFGPHKSRRWL